MESWMDCRTRQFPQTAYIRDRLTSFLSEENFRQPAVGADAGYEDHYASRALFDELKGRPGAVAFQYLLGKEDRRYIAWLLGKPTGHAVL